MASEQLNFKENSIEQSLGRFTVVLPEAMSFDVSSYNVNFTKIEEIVWNNKKDHQSEAEALWKKRLLDIKSVVPPKNINQSIIEVKDINKNGRLLKTVLSYPSRIHKNRIKYDVFYDLGSIGIWASMVGTENKVENIKDAVNNVIDNYKIFPSDQNGTIGPKYYLNHGYVSLPFKYAESSFVRIISEKFKSKLIINTKVVERVEITNLIERLSAALATNFAPGVSVDKIRAGTRSVAGLKGDEVVMRGTEGKKSELSFAWRFNGEKNSATAPKITIEMESPDGQLEEKLAIWDAVLNSMQVIPQ